jgi:hypothetical protein
VLHIDEKEIKAGLGEEEGDSRAPDFRNHGAEGDFAVFQGLLHPILEDHGYRSTLPQNSC